MAQPTTAADQDVVFLADGIDLIRDSRLLLNQVTFTVRSGEHWALLGPNGAGKSTLLRLLATYAHPTRGRIDILGRRLGRVDVFTLRPLIALVSSHQPVHAARTVRELVLTGATGTTDLRALLLRDGQMLAAGPAADVLTSDLVSTCFGYPVMIARHAGRWTCTAGQVGRR